jgi:hypothetical protein
MFSLPSYKTHSGAPANRPLAGARPEKTCPLSGSKSRERRAVFRFIRQTSYWLNGANEMAAINTILIIVNSFAL